MSLKKKKQLFHKKIWAGIIVSKHWQFSIFWQCMQTKRNFLGIITDQIYLMFQSVLQLHNNACTELYNEKGMAFFCRIHNSTLTSIYPEIYFCWNSGKLLSGKSSWTISPGGLTTWQISHGSSTLFSPERCSSCSFSGNFSHSWP